jgi:hypothetical protein
MTRLFRSPECFNNRGGYGGFAAIVEYPENHNRENGQLEEVGFLHHISAYHATVIERNDAHGRIICVGVCRIGGPLRTPDCGSRHVGLAKKHKMLPQLAKRRF